MNILFKLIGIGLLTAVLSLTVKGYKPELALFIASAGGICIACAVLKNLGVYISYFSEISRDTGIGKYGTVMLKALGIGLVTRAAADTCRDAGESSLASKLELAGKAEILILGFPLIKDVLGIAMSVL